jgi:hypothetical protein
MNVFENRITHFFIAKDIARTSSVTLSTLANGEVAIFTPSGTLVGYTAASTTPEIIIAQGRGTGNPPLISPVIKKSEVKAYLAGAYAAATEQVDYVGYNGTSGAIDVINDNIYILRLWLQGVTSLAHSRQHILDLPYKSDSSATQAEISEGLITAGIKTINRLADAPIAIEQICNNAGSAIGAATDTVVGTKGSKYVTITDVGGDTSVNAIAVGDYFRAGTATTAPVYRVVASTVGTGGGLLTLANPLQSAVNLVGNTSEFITAANAATSDFGVKLTGRALPFDVTKNRYEKVRFKTTLHEDFGTTTVTNSVGATEGNGVAAQVAWMERFYQGNEGNFYRSEANAPAPTMRADAENAAYSFIILDYSIPTTGGLNGDLKSPAKVVIALDRGTAFASTQVGDGNTSSGYKILDTLWQFSGTQIQDSDL